MNTSRSWDSVSGSGSLLRQDPRVETFQPLEDDELEYLLDGGQWIGYPARPEAIPRLVDFGFEVDVD